MVNVNTVLKYLSHTEEFRLYYSTCKVYKQAKLSYIVKSCILDDKITKKSKKMDTIKSGLWLALGIREVIAGKEHIRHIWGADSALFLDLHVVLLFAL